MFMLFLSTSWELHTSWFQNMDNGHIGCMHGKSSEWCIWTDTLKTVYCSCKGFWDPSCFVRVGLKVARLYFNKSHKHWNTIHLFWIVLCTHLKHSYRNNRSMHKPLMFLNHNPWRVLGLFHQVITYNMEKQYWLNVTHYNKRYILSAQFIRR